MPKSRSSLKNIVLTGSIIFGPGLLLLLCSLIPIAFLIPRYPSSADDMGMLSGMLILLVIVSLALLFSAAGAYTVWRAKKFWFRFLAALPGLQLLGFAVAFLFSSMLSGASMTVVDGVASARQLVGQEIEFSLFLMLILQLIIIPWALISSWIVGKISGKQEVHMPDASILE